MSTSAPAYTIEHLQPGAEISSPKVESGTLKLGTIPLGEFVRLDLPIRKQIITPILPERGLAMLFAA